MLEGDQVRQVKIDEVELPSGVTVEYYCTVGGPSIEECMDHVAEIAAEAILRNQIL